MSKIPQLPDQVFEQLFIDYKKIFGDELISIILIGSAARGEYVPKKSDINFLIVLTKKGIDQIQKILPVVEKWHKRKVATPVLLTKEYIQSALDSYPIEFLLMKEHHQVVSGEDVLSDITIKENDLRLECERELRGKLLLLRKSYLNTYGKSRLIKNLLSLSLPTFNSIFSALLHLKKKAVPSSKKAIFQATAAEFGFDYSISEKLIQLANNDLKLNQKQLNQLMVQFISQISELIKIVDKL